MPSPLIISYCLWDKFLFFPFAKVVSFTEFTFKNPWHCFFFFIIIQRQFSLWWFMVWVCLLAQIQANSLKSHFASKCLLCISLWQISPCSSSNWPLWLRAHLSTCEWVYRTCWRGHTWRSSSVVQSLTSQSRSSPCRPEEWGVVVVRERRKMRNMKTKQCVIHWKMSSQHGLKRRKDTRAKEQIIQHSYTLRLSLQEQSYPKTLQHVDWRNQGFLINGRAFCCAAVKWL